eukprot:g29465.t1
MGPENIPAIVLKTCAPDLVTLLAKVFECSYSKGVYPIMWKIAQGKRQGYVRQLLTDSASLDAQQPYKYGTIPSDASLVCNVLAVAIAAGMPNGRFELESGKR